MQVPLIADIEKVVYGAGKGNLQDATKIGTVLYNRGVSAAVLSVEAIRKAQEKYGKGKAMTGEQVRWGLENLNLDQAKLDAMGFAGVMRPVQTSCTDHMGSSWVRVHTWDGSKWAFSSDWYQAEDKVLRPMVLEAASKYAAEKSLQRRTAEQCAQ